MSSDDQHPRIVQRHAMQTDVGVIRDHNEDNAYVDEEFDFFIVADGMGGHAAGEVASQMAVDAVREALVTDRELIASFAREPNDDGRRELVSSLENAVRKAHQSVFERGSNESDKQGMGTTLDVMLVAGSEAFVAHVGDSRTYLIRDGRAAQITTDHTVAEVLVIEGKLSVEEAQISPLRTILVNAIGVAPDVGVEMAHIKLKAGDRLLLCSDGLHDYFPGEQEICDFVIGDEPKVALDKMVELAKNRGGHDNITGIVLEVVDVPPTPEPDEYDEPSRIGMEDTGSMAAVEPAEDDPDPNDLPVPQPVGRDDTMPIEALPSADERAERDRRSASGEFEAQKVSGEPSADDEEEVKQTLRIKPIQPKRRRRKRGSATLEPHEAEAADKVDKTKGSDKAKGKGKADSDDEVGAGDTESPPPRNS